MHIVFGIGNPGPEYEGTRHNLGFEVVDALAEAAGRRLQPMASLPAVGQQARVQGKSVLLVKPLTYVNLCGAVLQTLRKREGLSLDRLLVVVDDVLYVGMRYAVAAFPLSRTEAHYWLVLAGCETLVTGASGWSTCAGADDDSAEEPETVQH